MTRHPKTAARRGSFHAPRRVAAPARVVAGRGIHPSLLMWLQYAAMRAGWQHRRCPGCRDMRWIHAGQRACGACLADPTTAQYATWLNTIRHWNQRRTR